MLTNRVTNLRFDDHTSKAIPIDNGIGQGDPLSMGLYQFYNADLLSIPTEPNQLAIAYVNDAILYASGDTFEDTHKSLFRMMTKESGAIEWSTDHNSPLEYSKLALIDFSHQNCCILRPNLVLPHGTVEPKRSVKYLGVVLDQHLIWAPQRASTTEKGTNWNSQIRHITRPGWGVTLKYARRLFIGVALPKILYGADVWYTPAPSGTPTSNSRRVGTVQVTKKLARMQRAGVLAIMGGLHTFPSDTLNVLANLIPFDIAIEKWCFRAVLRLAALPDRHPLRKPVKRSAKHAVKKHLSPLHHIIRLLDSDPNNIGPKATKTTNPAKPKRLLFRLSIPPDKDSSKAEVQTSSDKVQIYTDRSVIEGKVGAAATLIRPGKRRRMLRYQLGKDSEYTIFDAELAGLSMGMHLIKTEKAA